MAQEGETSTSTNKRSEAPKLTDAELPSAKRTTTSPNEAQKTTALPFSASAADNITAGTSYPDPYEYSDSEMEEDDDDIIFLRYNTVHYYDTKGLDKALRAKEAAIKALGHNYEYAFEKIKSYQIEIQVHPESVMYVNLCKGGVAGVISSMRKKDR